MIKTAVSEFKKDFEFKPFAIRNDNEFYYVFENKEEYDEFVKSLPEKVVEPTKIDISNIDIDSLTDEQIAKLKTRFGL